MTAEYHEISVEAIDDTPEPRFAWKVSCSCGWSTYCSSAAATSQAIDQHRAELVLGG